MENEALFILPVKKKSTIRILTEVRMKHMKLKCNISTRFGIIC